MFRHEKVFAMERNCIVGQKSYNKPFFSFLIRNFVTPIIESVPKPARITPYPTGRLFWGGAVPGTSCQATIAPSLRDISQQHLARQERYTLGTVRNRIERNGTKSSAIMSMECQWNEKVRGRWAAVQQAFCEQPAMRCRGSRFSALKGAKTQNASFSDCSEQMSKTAARIG